MAGDRTILSIGLKEIIGNFTPAYLTTILLLTLINDIQNIIGLTGIILFSTVIAIALSAIQPHLLQRMLRLNNFIKTYMKQAVNNVMTDVKEEDLSRIEKILSNAFLQRFRLSIEEFFNEKEKKTGLEKQHYEIKESRIFLYFYLTIIFLLFDLLLAYQFIFGPIFWDNLIRITNQINNFPIYSLAFFSVMVVLFLFGFNYEIKRYKTWVTDSIPVFAITKEKNDLIKINEKIKLIKNSQDLNKKAKVDLLKKYEEERDEAEKLHFEEQWIYRLVSVETEIDIEEIQQISKKISQNIAKPSLLGTALYSIIYGLMATFIFAPTTFPAQQYRIVNSYLPGGGYNYGTGVPEINLQQTLPLIDPLMLILIFIVSTITITVITIARQKLLFVFLNR